MRKIVSLILATILMTMPVLALSAPAGDPVDGNDSPTVWGLPPACDMAMEYPQCDPCWTTCMFALMSEAWLDDGWNWDW